MASCRWLGPGIAAAAVGAAGSLVIASAALDRLRADFDTDARIAHRLLSQVAAQHDTILASLALLQPEHADRLPALYPQLLKVTKRERDAAWTDAALAAAEAESRARKRAVLAAFDAARGQYTLVRAAEPASWALVIDIAAMVPRREWPLPGADAAPVALRHAGAATALPGGAGDTGDAGGAGGAGGAPSAVVARLAFAKALAAESQPFELVAERPVAARELPWLAMLAWVAVVAAAASALVAWRRQREAARRAEELLRLGQVFRLNALGELAAGLAHELNQPLAALVAGTQAAGRLLADDPPDIATARDAMHRAVQQANRAAEVVARLRRLVQRPEAGAAPQPLSLAAAARRVADLLEPEAARRGVALRVVAGPGAPADALADPVAIEQIVHNLVMNALQALEQVPEGERELVVEVGRDAGEGRATLCVRDSGPGIAPDVLPRLFEPFFSTRRGGLGLGLSLCESLAAAMGGALIGTNRAPRGAEFRLTLPAAS